MPVEVGVDEYLLAHGSSRFLKLEKVQDLKRKGRPGAYHNRVSLSYFQSLVNESSVFGKDLMLSTLTYWPAQASS